jgi:hypothetical protein
MFQGLVFELSWLSKILSKTGCPIVQLHTTRRALREIFRINATNSGQIPKAIWLVGGIKVNLAERFKGLTVSELACDQWY